MIAHTTTKQEAQLTLELGLNRWESYNSPSDYSQISTEHMDNCWDIALHLDLATQHNTLGYYASKLTKKAIAKGYAHIQINSHVTKQGDTYDIHDTILHELAHHIHRTCYKHDREAHGAKWRWICQVIGANPRATQSKTN